MSADAHKGWQVKDDAKSHGYNNLPQYLRQHGRKRRRKFGPIGPRPRGNRMLAKVIADAKAKMEEGAEREERAEREEKADQSHTLTKPSPGEAFQCAIEFI